MWLLGIDGCRHVRVDWGEWYEELGRREGERWNAALTLPVPAADGADEHPQTILYIQPKWKTSINHSDGQQRSNVGDNIKSDRSPSCHTTGQKAFYQMQPHGQLGKTQQRQCRLMQRGRRNQSNIQSKDSKKRKRQYAERETSPPAPKRKNNNSSIPCLVFCLGLLSCSCRCFPPLFSSISTQRIGTNREMDCHWDIDEMDECKVHFRMIVQSDINTEKSFLFFLI